MGDLPVKYFDLKDSSAGIFAMGLVEDPAIGREWIMLSKKKPTETFKLATVDEEKQIVSGIALVPEMDIYREDKDGKGYNLRFTKETIFELGQGIIRNNVHSETTLDHDKKIEGVHLCEIWYIDDVTSKKALKLDPNPTLGSLALSYKVEDKTVWDEYIKTGKLTGFSIEASESKLSKQLNINKMSKPNLLDGLKSLISSFNEEVNLAEFVTEDGAVTLVAEALEQGNPIFVKEGEEEIAAPDGSYLFEDGMTVTVVDGVIESTEQMEAPTEEEMEERKATELAATKAKAVELSAAKEGSEKLDSILLMLEKQSKVVNLSKEDVVSIIKAELEALPTKLTKMGAPVEPVKKEKVNTRHMSTKERSAYLALN